MRVPGGMFCLGRGSPGPRTLVRGGINSFKEQRRRRNRSKISSIVLLVTIVFVAASIAVDMEKNYYSYFAATTATTTTTADSTNNLLLLRPSPAAGGVPPSSPSSERSEKQQQVTTTSSNNNEHQIISTSVVQDEQQQDDVVGASTTSSKTTSTTTTTTRTRSLVAARSNNDANANTPPPGVVKVPKASSSSSPVVVPKVSASTRSSNKNDDDRSKDQQKLYYKCFNGTHTVIMPRNAPSFIIIGAQKGGSTALQEIFTGHMFNVVRPKGIFGEVHYFDTVRLPEAVSDDEQQQLCSYRYNYLQKAYDLPKLVDTINNSKNPILSMEKTPSYMSVPGVSSTVHRVFGGSSGKSKIKIVAILRNPIQRVYSQYLMTVRHGTAISQTTTFDMYVQTLLDQLKKAQLSNAPDLIISNDNKADTLAATTTTGTTPSRIALEDKDKDKKLFEPVSASYKDRIQLVKQNRGPIYKRKKNGLYLGMYAQHLSEWLQYFDIDQNIKIIQYEKLQSNREQVFNELIDFLGIDNNNNNDDISEDGSNNNTATTTAKSVDSNRKALFERNYFQRQSYIPPNHQLSKQTEMYLRQFFKPYNDELANMLGEEWRNIWD